ncbi:MAG TPA: carbon starvation CstA family protein, partial [bacterium]|nr:carbon starvation CstA family protein [bacterium]
VWVFLQSRDFINVHILYAGLVLLVLILLAGGFGSTVPAGEGIPAFNLTDGTTALGWIWPTLMITIACGAVSGFHGMFAAGTTVKQLKTESAARTVGYGGMLLEVFLAVAVICIMLAGMTKANYLAYVHPKALLHLDKASNPVLGFAMAVGVAAKNAFGTPIAVGALAGMVMLEGFIITTLDTVVRLTRYLLEEAWRTMFAGYDEMQGVMPARAATAAAPIGTGGMALALSTAGESAPDEPVRRTAAGETVRALAGLVRHYWFNSGLAVVLMLLFALTGGVKALWGIFATANQLLAALILLLAALWLRRQRKPVKLIAIAALFMLVTTFASLFSLLREYLQHPAQSMPLLIADIVIIVLTGYCLSVGVIVMRRWSARQR